MSESEPSNFGGTLEPSPIVLLNRGAPPQQRTVSGHQGCVLAEHGGDCGCVTGQHRLEVFVSALNDRRICRCGRLSVCCSLCPECSWRASAQENECGNDSVHLGLLVNLFGREIPA